MKKYRLLQYLVLVSLLLVAAPSGAAGQTKGTAGTDTSAKLISNTATETVVAAGDYLLWLDARVGATGVYGYRISSGQVLALDTMPARRYALASDGQMVVWVESRDKEDVVVGYNLTTNTTTELVRGSDFGGLAVDQATLIYQDGSATHLGLYAHPLTSDGEHLLAAHGTNPVAHNGLVLWSEAQTKSGYQVPSVSLHLGQLNGKVDARLVASGIGCLTGYTLSAESIYWAFGCAAADRQVYAQSRRGGSAVSISSGEGRNPQAGGAAVAWTVPPTSDPATTKQWAINTQLSGKSQAVVAPSTAEVEARAITAAGNVAFTVKRDPASGSRELYLSPIDKTTSSFAVAPDKRFAPASCPQPLSCGQLYHNARDPYLRDASGVSKVKGVQFFLPGTGINGWTFYASNYWSALDNGEIEWWLDNAHNYLLANTLRIFVDLPGDGREVSDAGAIHDFAVRANARGMRIGIVMKNNAYFGLDQARRDWINNLLNVFISTGHTPMIAYVSAANEINNPQFCAGRTDCYDNNLEYVTNANRWVRDFAALIRSRAPILVTVGIVTDNGNGDDGLPAANDFFRRTLDPNVPRLVDIVDFLSPHNYGGGGYWVYDTVRTRDAHDGSYTAIVLEEYGFPTDPLGMSSYYNEGAESCRYDPLSSPCVNTAPYFVEINTRSMRERDYAGGVAWMLADVSGGNCGNSPPDFFTGLFSVSRAYCGGTHTPAGSPKTTGFRVRTHHYYY